MEEDPDVVVSPKDYDEIMEVFSHIDVDGNGWLEGRELAVIMNAIEPEFWNTERTELLLQAIDINQDARINFKEFLDWVLSGANGVDLQLLDSVAQEISRRSSKANAEQEAGVEKEVEQPDTRVDVPIEELAAATELELVVVGTHLSTEELLSAEQGQVPVEAPEADEAIEAVEKIPGASSSPPKAARDTVSLRFDLDFATTDHDLFKRDLLDGFRQKGVSEDEISQFRVCLREGSIIADVQGSSPGMEELRQALEATPIKVMGSTAEILEVLAADVEEGQFKSLNLSGAETKHLVVVEPMCPLEAAEAVLAPVEEVAPRATERKLDLVEEAAPKAAEESVKLVEEAAPEEAEREVDLVEEAAPGEAERKVNPVEEAVPEEAERKVDIAEEAAPEEAERKLDPVEEAAPEEAERNVDPAEEAAPKAAERKVDIAEEAAPEEAERQVDPVEEAAPKTAERKVDLAEEAAPKAAERKVDLAEEAAPKAAHKPPDVVDSSQPKVPEQNRIAAEAAPPEATGAPKQEEPKPKVLKTGKRTVRILVKSSKGLRDADWGPGTSDPYCKCEIKGKKKATKKTKVISECCAPVWNETLELDGCEDGDTLRFSVWDKDPWPKGDDSLGHVELESSRFFQDDFEGELELKDCGKGHKATLQLKVVTL